MTVYQKIDYLFSKINWGAGNLDADAIQIMNNLKKDISCDLNEVYNRLSEGRDYLMEVDPDKITVGDSLEAFGFGRNGERY